MVGHGRVHFSHLNQFFFPSVCKTEGRRNCFRRVTRSFIDFALKYRRSHLLYTLNDTFIFDFSNRTLLLVITEQGAEKLSLTGIDIFFDTPRSTKTTPYTGAYTNHHLSIFLFSRICRKCFGSIWTLNVPRPRGHKDCCVTLSQDNHTRELCHFQLR